jgi:hypothetical protein
MNGPCAKCAHFRRARPLSQLLQAAFEADMAAAEVTGALSKIVDDEQKLREAEADVKGKEGAADRDEWGARPVMSDYCGLDEASGLYRIAEVKNRGRGCEQFEPGRPVRHACDDCAHRVPADGRERARAMESIFARIANDAVAVQASAQGAQGLHGSYRSGEASVKALEISSAYGAKGRLLTRPAYLDHCGALADDEDEYVVCALQNTHNTCPAWAPGVSQLPTGEPNGH